MEKSEVDRWTEFCKAAVFGGLLGNITDHRKQKLWEEIETFIRVYEEEPVDGWCGNYCLCDAFRDHFVEYINDIWDDADGWQKENPHYFANQLEIVIRAGINAACNEGEGVIGFCVGDLRRMFGGSIPEWLICQYEGNLVQASDSDGICL